MWKGKILIEQKSAGKNLDRAHKQAIKYFDGLNDEDLPSHILASDFKRFRLYDLENDKQYDFILKDLYKKISLFNFLLNFKRREYKDEDPANNIAANLLGELHDALKDNGYTGHDLDVFIVRILFCLFADDTGIFDAGQFQFIIENLTSEDGHDVGGQLAVVFQVLNTPEYSRSTVLDEEIQKLRYINGSLYSEPIQIPIFDRKSRELLLKCCKFDWSKISPAIFGSIFQSIKNIKERRIAGEHYTSERNILKAIKTLFLDDLIDEFDKSKPNSAKLSQLHNKMGSFKFLDPACGCGNFLVIAYRELRLLELEILKILTH